MIKRNKRKSANKRFKDTKRSSHLRRNNKFSVKKGFKKPHLRIDRIILVIMVIVFIILIHNQYKKQHETDNTLNKMINTLETIQTELEDMTDKQVQLEEKHVQLEEKQKELEVSKAQKKEEEARLAREAEEKARIAKEEARKAEEAKKQEQIKVASTKPVTSRGGTTVRESSSSSKSGLQSYAHDLCINTYGWSENDYQCLVKLWNRESGWNPNAHNKSSGAYGIPQSLPASKMSSEGSDYYTNGKTQIRWGLKYIKNRYGTPASAWAHSESHHWY